MKTIPLGLQELGKLGSLSLFPHLDLEAWEGWRKHIAELHTCMTEILRIMENQSASASARMAQARTSSSFFINTSDAILVSGIEFREASGAVQINYINVEKALKGCQPYHPLSLSYFEPTNYSERYWWLKNISLSFPVALLKFAVGGTLGVLVWVLKRDAAVMELGDHAEIEDAQNLVRPIVPRVCEDV